MESWIVILETNEKGITDLEISVKIVALSKIFPQLLKSKWIDCENIYETVQREIVISVFTFYLCKDDYQNRVDNGEKLYFDAGKNVHRQSFLLVLEHVGNHQKYNAFRVLLNNNDFH